MDEILDVKRRLEDKFRRLYEEAGKQGLNARGGIFTTKTRKRLLGILGQSGRDRTKNDFWYDMREYVKTTLIDLQLFIETAENKHVDQVLNVDSLTPVIDTLFKKEDATGAKIAHMLIERGFTYLRQLDRNYLLRLQEQQIEDAIELSKQLTILALPEAERSQFLWSGGRKL